MAGVYVFNEEEEFGTVKLTANELEYLIRCVTVKNPVRKGSTCVQLAKKITKATKWNLCATQMFCRFAYRHGLVKL